MLVEKQTIVNVYRGLPPKKTPTWRRALHWFAFLGSLLVVVLHVIAASLSMDPVLDVVAAGLWGCSCGVWLATLWED